MSRTQQLLDVVEDRSILRHQIANRLTSVERRLMEHFAAHRSLVVCVGNIGAGKSSLVKFLAYNTGMNALFELPDEGFEDHILDHEALHPLLGAAKDTARRALGEYYGAINDFIKCQREERDGSQRLSESRRTLEKAVLDMQHAYLDLRRMQLLAVSSLEHSTVIDGSPWADRYAFCEVLHRELDISYLTEEGLKIIDDRLGNEFRQLRRPDLLIYLYGPLEVLYQNIGERSRNEERNDGESDSDIPEGLARLVRALSKYYDRFVNVLRMNDWYDGPVLRIDVSRVDFISNVRHLIAVYESIEELLCPDRQLGLFN